MKLLQFEHEYVLRNLHLCNSRCHPPDSLLSSLPSFGIQEPPDSTLTNYRFWHPPILQSQRSDPRRVKIVHLPVEYMLLLVDVSESPGKKVNFSRVYRQGLFDLFWELLCTPDGLESGPRYFLRFDNFSPTDSVNARQPLQWAVDVIRRIYTSQRAINAIKQSLRRLSPIRLYFVPYDPLFDPRTEYRCFSAPVSAICTESKVSAVSQRLWRGKASNYKALDYNNTKELLRKIQSLHHEILAYARALAPEVEQGLRQQGFVFDVRCLGEGRVQLINVKDFGIASRTRSALFHWIDDAGLLYGGKQEVEVRTVC